MDIDHPAEPFEGFPPAALAFYAGLRADNTKAYWEAHRHVWEDAARRPMLALIAVLADEFGPFRVFRPYRDVRFSRDKAPYKDHLGAVGERPGGTAHYVHLSAAGLLAATGHYVMAGDQLERFRAAVADDRHGTELERIIARLEAAGLAVGPGGEDPLKTAPRGYPADHPRIGLLRGKGLAVTRHFGAPAWLHTPEVVDHLATFWRAAAPLNGWLDAHVGRSADPAERPGRRRG